MRRRLNRAPVRRVDTPVGSAVAFAAESHPFTVRAVSRNRRWVICTRPFLAADRGEFPDADDFMVIYTVIDWDSGVRGPDDYHGLGYETPEQIAQALEMFETGDAEISVRSDVYLDVVAVTAAQ